MSCNNTPHPDINLWELLDHSNGLNDVAQASMVTPFMHLPPEILGQIAVHGLGMEDGPKPSILNQVSAFMRSTINGTKILWSTVCIVRSIRNASRVNQILCANAKYLRLVLGRAAPVPLTIVLREQLDADMAEILLSHCSIIKCIRLYEIGFKGWMGGWEETRACWGQELPFLALTSLESLEIVTGELSPSSYTQAFMNMAMRSRQNSLALGLPKLKLNDLIETMQHPLFRHITSLDITLDSAESRTMITHEYSMPRLEHLSLRGGFIPIATSAPNLRFLDICCVRDAGVLRPHILPVTLEELLVERMDIYEFDRVANSRPLTHLTCLTLVAVDLHDGFCPHFSLPNLQELTLSRVSLIYEQYAEERPILHRSGIFGHLPALRRLWVDKMYQTMMDDFSFCPNLLVLRISSCGFLCDPLDSLSMDPTTVARLEEIFVGWIQDSDFVMGDFLQACSLNRPSLRIHMENDFHTLQYPFREGLRMEW